MSRTRAVKIVAGLSPLVLLLGIWQLVGKQDSPYYPPPSTWWDAVEVLNQRDLLLPALRETIETFVLALAVAIVVGSLLGLAIGALRRVERATSPLIEFCRTLPPPAIVPVAVLLIGLGRSMAIVVVVFAAIWPIVLNTAAAVRSLSPVLQDMARTLGLPAGARVRKVLAPALVPGLLLGIRVATPICVIVTLLVEMLTGASGIGSLLVQAQRNFVSAQAFGLLVVVGLFGFLVNTGVNMIERRVLRAWPPRATAR
jgi:ABC-type nitrate/sulfonate/bicarbonate transport system permease component